MPQGNMHGKNNRTKVAFGIRLYNSKWRNTLNIKRKMFQTCSEYVTELVYDKRDKPTTHKHMEQPEMLRSEIGWISKKKQDHMAWELECYQS